MRALDPVPTNNLIRVCDSDVLDCKLATGSELQHNFFAADRFLNSNLVGSGVARYDAKAISVSSVRVIDHNEHVSGRRNDNHIEARRSDRDRGARCNQRRALHNATRTRRNERV